MKLCPHCNEPLDARALKWQVRVRLYAKGSAEPLADTDPDLAADKPGTALIATLPAVAEHVAKLATGFHVARDGEITGLDLPTLRHKLRSLRPTISRRKGNATWRVHYTVIPERADRGESYPHDYVARVDVVRVQAEST